VESLTKDTSLRSGLEVRVQKGAFRRLTERALALVFGINSIVDGTVVFVVLHNDQLSSPMHCEKAIYLINCAGGKRDLDN